MAVQAERFKKSWYKINMKIEKLRQDVYNAIDAAGEALLMPGYISEIENLISDPKASARDLCDIIDSEPGLSHTITNAANSPFYSLSKRAANTIQAVQAIGFKEVVAIARCRAIYALFATNRSSLPEKIIIHGNAVGTTAVLLAIHLKVKHSAEIFLAGLVHDIGKVFMSLFMPEKFEKFIWVLNDPENLLGYHKLEAMIFGITHSETGAAVLERTGFDKNILDVVLYHHLGPEKGQFPLLACIIHIADIICNIKGLTPFKGFTFPLVEPDMLLLLQDAKKDFGTADMASLADMVDIEIERLRPFYAALR
jgi:putative nucleotidyltransferase with HDIG domain